MLRVMKASALIVLLCVVSMAADWPNNECLNSGTFTCQDQSRRICNTAPTCAGTVCYYCNSTPDIPKLVCFVKEGASCEPVDPLKCGPKEFGKCVQETPTTCICQLTGPTTGTCDFTSCKMKAP